jgi:hypothetical protein
MDQRNINKTHHKHVELMVKMKSDTVKHYLKRDENKIKTVPRHSGQVNNGSHVQKLKSDLSLQTRHDSAMTIVRLLLSRFQLQVDVKQTISRLQGVLLTAPPTSAFTAFLLAKFASINTHNLTCTHKKYTKCLNS